MKARLVLLIHGLILMGILYQLVDQHSAVVPGMQNAESIALNKDHIGIAKFMDGNDADLRFLCRTCRGWPETRRQK